MIKAEETIALLSAAVANRGGDYVYPEVKRAVGIPPCVYFEDDGSPSCIVGMVGSMVGVRPSDITDHAGVYDEPIFHEKFDDLSIEILETAQTYQDQRYNWGEALEHALETYTRSKDAYASNSDN